MARFFCSSKAFGVRGGTSSPMKARSTIASRRSAFSLSAGIVALNFNASALKPGSARSRLRSDSLRPEGHEPLHATAMRGIGFVAGVHEADRDARLLVHERGIAGEGLVAAPETHLLGQVAEIPCRDAFALHPRLRFRESEARGLPQALAKLAQVAAHRELTPRLVDDAHVHPQVRGRLLLRPDVARKALAGDSRGVIQHCVLHGLLPKIGPRSRARADASSCSRNFVTCSGTGTSCVRMRFSRAFIDHATFSRIIPGTSQSISLSSTWLSSAAAR